MAKINVSFKKVPRPTGLARIGHYGANVPIVEMIGAAVPLAA